MPQSHNIRHELKKLREDVTLLIEHTTGSKNGLRWFRLEISENLHRFISGLIFLILVGFITLLIVDLNRRDVYKGEKKDAILIAETVLGAFAGLIGLEILVMSRFKVRI
jgi:hypothetical protein